MWPLKTMLYFGLFWAGCVAALFNPIWGVINYMFVYQLDPTDRWWGMPITAIGIRLSLLAALSSLLGMLLARGKLPRFRPAISWWELCLFGLFIIATMNIVIGVGFTSTSQVEFEKFWKLLLFTLVLGRVASSRANLHLVIWTLVVGSLYLGYDAFTAPMSSFVLGRLENIGGPDFSTTSGAAAHLTAMLPIIGAAFLIARDWKWKLLAAVSGGLTVNAIIMCRTRSAFVGLVVGALTAFLVAPRARRFRIHALLIAGACIAFSLTDDQFWVRMETMTDQQALETDLATVSRREIWVAAMDIFEDHPLGIGVGNFVQMIGQYAPRHNKRSSHNSLVVCFVELGAHGGILYLLMVAGSLRFIHRSYKLAWASKAPLETQMLAYGLLISLLTYFVTALGTQRFYCESFWWVLIFPLCLYRVTSQEAEVCAEAPLRVMETAAADEPAQALGLQHEF
jgi:hypothetical protein